jgi:UDP-N-acetylmuramyl pentapeptide phosphotransferase/UDP-N-acetylglucosamine-1-phosphate transferase
MFNEYLDFIFNNQNLRIILSFFGALIISIIAIPTIIDVARARRLFDTPNSRTSHVDKIPTLGGLSIFAGFFISSLIFINIKLIPDFQYVIAGSLMIFFIGLKDDILAISPFKKLIGQIVASIIVIELGNIRFTSLHGFLGIYEIDYLTSVLLTLFVLIVIINSFNLIDGIDGLASGIGIVSSVTFGIWFYLVGEYQLTIMAASLVGALIAFFVFNVFGRKNKIFMGDIGSLLLGFITAIFIVKFNELNINPGNPYFVHSSPAVSIGILIVPLFDTLRVFINRLIKKKSPFKADRGHVHHRVLKLTNSHFKATLILMLVNIGFIVLVFLLQNMGIYKLTLIILILAIVFTYLPVLLLRMKKKNSVHP